MKDTVHSTNIFLLDTWSQQCLWGNGGDKRGYTDISHVLTS